MAVVHKATASAVGGNDATVTIPASVVEGDLLVAHTSNKNNAGNLDVPAGWVLIEEVAAGLTLSVAYKIATSTDAGSDVLFKQKSTTANAAAIIDVFTGHDPFTPIGVHASEDAGVVTNPQTPDVAAEFPGLLLCGTAQEVASQATAATPPLTLANDEPNSAYTITVTTGYDQVDAGLTGSREFTRGTSAKSKVSSVIINALGAWDGFPILDDTRQTDHITGSPAPTVSLPSGDLGDGLLIVGWIGYDGAAFTWDDGFTELQYATGTGAGALSIAYKEADGTEGSAISVSVTDSDSHQLAFMALRFKAGSVGKWAAYPPDAALRVYDTSQAGEDSDPPLLSPGWGVEKIKWLAGSLAGSDTLTAVGPPGYDSIGRPSSVFTLRLTARDLEAQTEDPGLITWDQVVQSIALTVGILGGSTAIPSSYEGFGAVNI